MIIKCKVVTSYQIYLKLIILFPQIPPHRSFNYIFTNQSPFYCLQIIPPTHSNAAIILCHGLGQPVAERRDPGKRCRFSNVTDLIAKGDHAHQNGKSLSVAGHQRATAIPLARTLRILLEPLGTQLGGNDRLTEALLALRIGDHLEAHLVQVRGSGTVGAELAIARHLHREAFQSAPFGRGVADDRDAWSTGHHRQTEQGDVVVVRLGRVLGMNDAVVGELRVGHLVDVDAAQTDLGAGIWPRETMRSGDYPERVNKGAAAGTVDALLGIVLVDGRLPWNLTGLGAFPLDDCRVDRVIAWDFGGGLEGRRGGLMSSFVGVGDLRGPQMKCRFGPTRE